MSEIRKPFIHFHIPKTAGTSLRATFVNEFSADGVAFRLYDGNLVRMRDMPFTNVERLDKVRRISRRLGLLNAYSAVLGAVNKRTITNPFILESIESQNIQVATGHFKPEDIKEEVNHLPRTTIVRDPLDRMRSHYNHWREAQGNMWWHSGEVPYGDDVTFEKFATDAELANYQTKYIGHLGFAVIGSTVDLPRFFNDLGMNSTSIPILNPARHNANTEFDPGFVREFREMNEADYELFEKVSQ